MPPLPTIRAATPQDMPAVGRLAASLVRFHHALNPRRFLCMEPAEPGYERWLTKELANPKAVVVVAEAGGPGNGSAAGAGARESAPAQEGAAREDAAPEGGAAPGRIVGYAYGRLEPRDWNALLDAFGALHDVFVAEDARAQGVGAALVEAVAAELKEKGAPRVVLNTATQNAAAQRLFAKLGFAPTMLEMTRELA